MFPLAASCRTTWAQVLLRAQVRDDEAHKKLFLKNNDGCLAVQPTDDWMDLCVLFCKMPHVWGKVQDK